MKHSLLLLVAALGTTAASLPSQEETSPGVSGAPAGTEQTRYCMRIEAVTGTRIEEIRCWTRAEWAELGVNVDRDWAEEGVRTIG